jgi:hypothetical protein
MGHRAAVPVRLDVTGTQTNDRDDHDSSPDDSEPLGPCIISRIMYAGEIDDDDDSSSDDSSPNDDDEDDEPTVW